MARRFQSSPLNILYEDDQIIVCVKPHGIATQSRSVAVPDMERLIKNHLCRSAPGNAASAGKEPYLAVIHRLDQPVTGILVFAKTKSAARELSQQLTDPKKNARTQTAASWKITCAKTRGPTLPVSAAKTLPAPGWPAWNSTSLWITSSIGDGGFLKIPRPQWSRPSYLSTFSPAATTRSGYSWRIWAVRSSATPNIIHTLCGIWGKTAGSKFIFVPTS